MLDIIENNQGKANREHFWEIKQTRRDRMANTASHITFLQLFFAWSVYFLL